MVKRAGLAAVVVLAILVVAAAVFFVVGWGPAVPDVKGKTVQQAEQVLVAAGFVLGPVTYAEGAQGAAGSVFAQTPNPGARATKGDAVSLIVAGPAPVPVPDLIGLDKERASVALNATGLQLGGVTDAYAATAAVGTVASQEPSAGVGVPKGSAVAIVLSRGPQPVTVPNVVGKPVADAEKTLAAAGFAVKTVDKSNSAKKGTVIAQVPKGGGSTQPRATVVLTVSTGVQLVKVPDFVAMNRDMWSGYSGGPTPDSLMAGRIRDAGFSPRVVLDDNRSPTASYQSPRAGSHVARGSRVTLVIGVIGD